MVERWDGFSGHTISIRFGLKAVMDLKQKKRKRKPNAMPTTIRTLRLPDSLDAKIKALAQDENRSINNEIVVILTRAVEKKENEE